MDTEKWDAQILRIVEKLAPSAHQLVKNIDSSVDQKSDISATDCENTATIWHSER
jgi:hypothetical protein